MPPEVRKEIESIFEQSVKNLGEDVVLKESIISPTLMNQSSTAKFKELNDIFYKLQVKYKKQIENN